jgi:hypothetical protein
MMPDTNEKSYVCWTRNRRGQPEISVYHGEIPASHKPEIERKMSVHAGAVAGQKLPDIGAMFPFSHPGMKATGA